MGEGEGVSLEGQAWSYEERREAYRLARLLVAEICATVPDSGRQASTCGSRAGLRRSAVAVALQLLAHSGPFAAFLQSERAALDELEASIDHCRETGDLQQEAATDLQTKLRVLTALIERAAREEEAGNPND